MDRFFNERQAWSRLRYTAFLVALFCLLAALPYWLTNQIAAWRDVSVGSIEIWLDREIPYSEWSIWFYIAYYLYIPALAWLGAAAHRREEALVFFQRFVVISWIPYMIFIFLPIEVTLRDQVVYGDGFYRWFMTDLHSADPPFNSWPSLHVFQSFMMLLAARAWLMKDGRWTPTVATAGWLTTALIWYSTVGIKQHYLLDIFSGLVFTATMWHLWVRHSINQTGH